MYLSELMSHLTDIEGPINTGVTWDDVEISKVTLDSRQAGTGVLFIACKGVLPTSKNGHDFIPQTIGQGVSALLVEEVSEVILDAQVPVWKSKDTRRDIAILSEVLHDRPGTLLKTIGITGTNGKSSVAFGLSSLLEALNERCAVMGTLGFGHPERLENWGMTTPEAEVLSERLKQLVDDQFTSVAMEVSSHALATQRVAGLTFDICIFTNLTHEHLDFHHSFDAYYDAKKSLFERHSLPESTWILPFESDVGKRLQRDLSAVMGERLTWGFDAQADIAVTNLELTAHGLRMDLKIPHETLTVEVPWLGRFNAENIACIVACAVACGYSGSAIQDALRQLKAPPGRMQVINTAQLKPAPVVIVDYAHTPDALENALATLKEVCQGRVWVVFGCGGDRDRAKRPLMGKVAGAGADCIIITNDNPRTESPQVIADEIEKALGQMAHRVAACADLQEGSYCLELNREKAIQEAIQLAGVNDMVLVAGKGHETQQIIGDTVLHFNDAAVAATALEKRFA